jgi:hypothetical protein
MGCDIHYMAQVQIEPGKWVFRPDWKFYNDRSYNLFGVLANVRNMGKFPYISEPRGFPLDTELDDYDSSAILGRWMGDHSYTWLSLRELVEFDYDQIVTSQRDGETGPLRDFLPSEYFSNLAILKHELRYVLDTDCLSLDDVRILIGFDN